MLSHWYALVYLVNVRSQHPDPLVISSSVKEQVATYLATDKPRKTDVFCLYAGANEAFSSPAMNFTGTQAVALLGEQIGQLYKKGSLINLES